MIYYKNFNYKIILLTVALLSYTYDLSAQEVSSLNTDKSMYKPGDTVLITLNFSSLLTNSKLFFEYYHLDKIIDSVSIESVAGLSYQSQWITPQNDYKGYLLKVTLICNDMATDSNNIAIDVSSDWKRFPRYGFLSKYPILSTTDVNAIIDNLNRYHINGLQFYDWQWKHHKPLKGTPGNISSSWLNIANQTIYLSTIQKYLVAANNKGMHPMAYNLLYGAYSNASIDSVSNEWRIYKDAAHQLPDFHDLPASWASDLYLIDHSNSNWVNYINNEMNNVFLGLNFKGWHIDQLGDRGTRYKYNGQTINMTSAFESFIDTTESFLNVPLVCNAVNNYAQSYIAKTNVGFLYTEVWSPYDSYTDLVSLINYNSTFSNRTKNTVLAAYIHKGLSGSAGYFNTPTVLFADAVIFASGGSHIELGEHMLCNEYFPNNNLAMTGELKSSLIKYYDFLTAYQNILRDSLNGISLSITSSTHPIVSWPIQQGKIWVYARAKNNLLILNTVNFTQSTTMNWRDDTAIQQTPELITNINLSLPFKETVNNVWYASPDNELIVPENVTFSQDSDFISIQLPKLKYWSTLVIEFDNNITSLIDEEIVKEKNYSLEQNYPNPFNPYTVISYQLPIAGNVTLKIYDVLGKEITTLVNEEKSAGQYEVNFNATQLTSGVYLYKLQAGNYIETKKMIFLK